jgi:hypothetical protein
LTTTAGARGLLAALLLVGMSACTQSSVVLSGGPLAHLGGSGRLCVVTDPDAPVTVGSDLVNNAGSQPLVIDSVQLRAPRNLRLVGGFLVPIEGHDLLGNGLPYPPTTVDPSTGVRWDERTPFAGATIQPGPHVAQPGSTAPRNLVIGLVTHGGGTASGVDVRYHVGDQGYLIASDLSLTVRVKPDTCARGGY